jgi:hypothetical protein
MQTNTPISSERVQALVDSLESTLRELRQVVGASRLPQPVLYHTSEENDGGIEGIFDGERMVDSNGKTYQVSANYASKSKLVVGDPLKLYITPDGKFFYKQLGPVDRRTLTATVRADGNHFVLDTDEGRTYQVLTASVTYYMSLFNLQVGDRVSILVPSFHDADYAVIDNVL